MEIPPNEFPKTPQAMFDIAATHLLTQRKPAKAHMDSMCYCRLVTEEGETLMCALGACIPESVYTPQMELIYAYQLLSAFSQVLGLDDDAVDELTPIADDLQRLHDHYKPEEWLGELERVATYYKLDASVLDQFRGE